MADIYGKPILRPACWRRRLLSEPQLLAGVGVGLFPDFNVADELVQTVERNDPNPDVKPVYDRNYAIFNRPTRHLCRCTRPCLGSNPVQGGFRMKYRSFGRTGWQVSEIGFGAWAIGASWAR